MTANADRKTLSPKKITSSTNSTNGQRKKHYGKNEWTFQSTDQPTSVPILMAVDNSSSCSLDRLFSDISQVDRATVDANRIGGELEKRCCVE